MSTSTPTPYTIAIPESDLDILADKLAHATLPDELSAEREGAEWDRGSPLADISRLSKYWRDQYTTKLNELPNYQTEIHVDGFGALNMHFVWQKSDIKEGIPLLFVHGWPGSFIEVTKILSLLKGDRGGPAFHIVAPSLPNFGFSEGAKKRGFALPQYAETCHKLMLSLGYDKYVTQGGDWGMYITRCIGLLYPSHCLASHTNYPRGLAPTFFSNPLLTIQHALTPYTTFERAGLERQKWFFNEGQSYRLQQGTKPQTLGYALADSPVALLAWIYEKLHDWTDGYPWTDDEILTWVSIYWFSTAGPAASVRIYYESVHDQPWAVSKDGTASGYVPQVKLGLSYFPKELGVIPKLWGKTLGNVVYEKVHEKGGHFAAWEVPEAIAGDLKAMFGRRGPCAGIVKGREGYKRGTAKL